MFSGGITKTLYGDFALNIILQKTRWTQTWYIYGLYTSTLGSCWVESLPMILAARPTTHLHFFPLPPCRYEPRLRVFAYYVPFTTTLPSEHPLSITQLVWNQRSINVNIKFCYDFTHDWFHLCSIHTGSNGVGGAHARGTPDVARNGSGSLG